MTVSRDDQPDLLSDLSDLDFVRHLLADLHDDLPEKVSRLRMLTDLGGQMGRSGTIIFGGHAAYQAWAEARSSFVHGNFVATILLCQGLVEHLLAAYLHAGLLVDDLPDRIQFADTLRRCREREVISDEDVTDLRRMMALRNPLSHFRHVDDGSNLDRRRHRGEHFGGGTTAPGRDLFDRPCGEDARQACVPAWMTQDVAHNVRSPFHLPSRWICQISSISEFKKSLRSKDLRLFTGNGGG